MINASARIIEKDGSRFLFNNSNESIQKFTYQTASVANGVISACPTYEIQNIPPKHCVFMEENDPYEDGEILFFNTKIIFENGTEEQIEKIRVEGLFSRDYPGPISELLVSKIDAGLFS